MKKLTAVLLLLIPVAVAARINVFEPWYPGLDAKIGQDYSYQYIGSVLFGNHFQEVPFQMVYCPGGKVELGGRWGVKHFEDSFGINDLLLGAKYAFLEESVNKPSVIGELAFSLPTGDHNKGLGMGSVGMLLNWAMEKRINNLTGNFGIGMLMFSENSDKVQYGNTFSYRIGASAPYSNLWRLHMEFKGFNHSPTKVAGVRTVDSYQEIYLAPGATYTPPKGDKVWSGALLFGLSSEADKLGFIFSCNF